MAFINARFYEYFLNKSFTRTEIQHLHFFTNAGVFLFSGNFWRYISKQYRFFIKSGAIYLFDNCERNVPVSLDDHGTTNKCSEWYNYLTNRKEDAGGRI